MEITLAGNAIEFASTVPPPIVARITGTAGVSPSGQTIYTWEEMSPSPAGDKYAVTRGGRVGDGTVNPAYEINNATADTGTIVLLRARGAGSSSQGQTIYEYALGGGGSTVKVLRVIADWSNASQYTPVQAPGLGYLYYANILDDTGSSYGQPDSFVLPTAPESPGPERSTVLRHLGDYIGIKTANLHQDTPIYLVPNTYYTTWVPYSFVCGDNGLEITYQQLRIPNGISLGFNTP